jgi:hypothetical protein
MQQKKSVFHSVHNQKDFVVATSLATGKSQLQPHLQVGKILVATTFGTGKNLTCSHATGNI